MLEFNGRVAVITGAASGFGRAFAETDPYPLFPLNEYFETEIGNPAPPPKIPGRAQRKGRLGSPKKARAMPSPVGREMSPFRASAAWNSGTPRTTSCKSKIARLWLDTGKREYETRSMNRTCASSISGSCPGVLIRRGPSKWRKLATIVHRL